LTFLLRPTFGELGSTAAGQHTIFDRLISFTIFTQGQSNGLNPLVGDISLLSGKYPPGSGFEKNLLRRFVSSLRPTHCCACRPEILDFLGIPWVGRGIPTHFLMLSSEGSYLPDFCRVRT